MWLRRSGESSSRPPICFRQSQSAVKGFNGGLDILPEFETTIPRIPTVKTGDPFNFAPAVSFPFSGEFPKFGQEFKGPVRRLP